MSTPRPIRRRLPHEIPSWVPDGSIYFITICAKERGGSPLLASAALTVRAAATYHEIGRWHLQLFVLMPDHVHMLVSFPAEKGMRRTVSEWKSFTAKQAGFRWQTDFFDHRLRGDENLDEKAHYVRMNPVRAGLCAEPGDWPHRWPEG
jgi:REP element-mobilizing transposase RayT